MRPSVKCGLVYGEDNSVWIQCDSCGLWYDLKCTNANHDNIRHLAVKFVVSFILLPSPP